MSPEMAGSIEFSYGTQLDSKDFVVWFLTIWRTLTAQWWYMTLARNQPLKTSRYGTRCSRNIKLQMLLRFSLETKLIYQRDKSAKKTDKRKRVNITLSILKYRPSMASDCKSCLTQLLIWLVIIWRTKIDCQW